MHTWLPRILVGLASILAILAIFAVWAERQLLETDAWVKTSSALLRNEHVQKQSTEYLANQVTQNVDVAAQLQAALPLRLAPSPIRWPAPERGNTAACLAAGVTIRRNAVVIDLRPMIGQLATRAGISPDVPTSSRPKRAS